MIRLRQQVLSGLIILGVLLLSVAWAAAQSGAADQAPGPLVAGPRNIIVMIADGAGFASFEAARLYEHGNDGASIYDRFPAHYALSTYLAGGKYDSEKTWADFDYAKKGATDSGAAATALACGVKTKSGRIGVDAQGRRLENIMERSKRFRRAAGVITSVPISHATPAGFAAHNITRSDYVGIGREMIEESALDVIMGAGHPRYNDSGRRTSKDRCAYVGGPEVWARLQAGVAGGDADGDGKPDPWTLVERLSEFEALLGENPPARVLGLARVASTLQEGRRTNPKSSDEFKADPYVVPFNAHIPSLALMTKGALNVLSQNPRGFTLMIEGGAVDWANHSNLKGRLIEEMIDFNHSVEAVVEWVEANSSWDETLLIVTADHETGHLRAPGKEAAYRGPIGKGAGVLPEMEYNSGSHTNNLVPLYLWGRGSELFELCVRGTDPVFGKYVDNTDVARVSFFLMTEK
jgi:alkaline phosphatase